MAQPSVYKKEKTHKIGYAQSLTFLFSHRPPGAITRSVSL